MNIFNRKNKNEEKIDELKQQITITNDLITELKQTNNELLTKIHQQEEKIKDFEEKSLKIEEQNQKLHETQKTQQEVLDKLTTTIKVKLDKLTETIQTEPKSEEDVKNDNHLYQIKKQQPYTDLKLNETSILTGNKSLTFSIKDVISIKKKLHKFNEQNLTIEQISEIYNLPNETTERLIWNIEEGNLNNLINEYETLKESSNTTPNTNNHIRQLGDSYKRDYKKITLNNTTVYVNGKKYVYNIDEIIKVQERIPLTNEYRTLQSLFKDMEFNDYRSKVLLWNIEEGNFDEIINEYKNNQEKEKVNVNHIREIPSSLVRVQDNVILNEDKLISKGHLLKYTIEDIINIKEKVYDTVNYPTVKSICDTIPSLSRMTISVIIWNIEEGNYDNILQQYTIEKEESENYHIFPLKNSYQVSYVNLSVGDEGEIYNSLNQKLPFNIYDIMEMKRRIYSGKKTDVTEIYSDLNFSNQLGNKLVWNIEEGNFDDLIDEFNSRNYTFERKYNHLYIDDEDTGLTIEECNVIIDCIINEPNKAVTINKLIKTYSNVNPKFIRIIGEEYNNINLSKILTHEVNKVKKVNNPQKRKEQGI